MLLVATSALGQNVESRQNDRLDSARLLVRMGVLDFDIKVGELWNCLSHLPTGPAKVIKRESNEDGEMVRVQFASGRWMDIHFRLIGDTALLDSARMSDGSYSDDWKELYMTFGMFLNSCRN
jgi:hypothetical protein